MARDLNDDPLKQLEAALSVTPSPEFAASVRERVRQEPARVSWGWWSVAAAGVALLVVGAGVASVAIWRHESTQPATIVATTTPAPVETAAPAAPTVVSAPVAPVAPTVTRTTPKPATTRPAAVLASTRSRQPEVLVPPDEGIAIRRLLKAIREGRATVPAPGLRVMEGADGHLLEPVPMDIPLIKIELLPGTPAVGSGGIVK